MAAEAASETAGKGAEAATAVAERVATAAQEGATAAQQKAQQGATFAKQRAQQGATFAQQKATEGAAFTKEKAEQAAAFTKQKATEGAAFTKEKAEEAAAFTKEKAQVAAAFTYDKAATAIDIGIELGDKYTHSLKADETFAAKGGTIEGFKQAHEMVTTDAHVNADARLVALESLLIRKNAKLGPGARGGKVTRDARHVQQGDAAARRRWRAAHDGHPGRGRRGSLEDVLREAFKGLNTYTSEYIVSMLHNDGVPSRTADPRRVRQGLRRPDRPQQQGTERGDPGDLPGHDALRGDEHPGVTETQGDPQERIRPVVLLAEGAKDAARVSGSQTGRSSTRWLKGWDKRLAADVRRVHKRNTGSIVGRAATKISKTRKKKVSSIVHEVRKGLGRIIAGEIEFNQVGAVRAQLATDHSLFEAALSEADYVDAQLRARLIKAVTTGDVDSLVLPDDTTPDPNETAEHKELREQRARKDDAKDLAAVGVARSLLGTGGVAAEDLEKTGLVKFVRR